MKRESFQKKRRPAKGGLFVFHSKTGPRRRRKQRVAAGAGNADLGSEVPNLGVARALLVILVLHVAAIAAIFIHNRVTEEDAVASVADVQPTTAAVGVGGREKLPVVQKGEDFYFVATGDTYDRIARLKGIDVEALRDLNENVKLKAGRILRIPAGGVAAPPVAAGQVAENPAPAPAPEPTPAPEPSVAVRVTPASAPTADAHVISDRADRPPIVVRREVPAEPIRVVVDSEAGSEREIATKVSPNVAPREIVAVAAETSVPETGSSYTIKKGDTAWGISRSHKVSVDRLLEANGITDARKLRPGMKLSIPAE